MESIDPGANPVYKWEPLNLRKNEFRILKLREIVHEQQGEVVSVSVHNVPMSGHPAYNALSYTWGDRSCRRKILLGGFPHLITENLHQALCVLLNRGVQNIWVDALCIDQNDPDEKSVQVGRMATIFQEAETVDIWLGPATSDSDTVLDFMRNVDHSTLERDFWAQDLRVLNSNSVLRFNQSFHDLLSRPYWERLWVVQEIAMASKTIVSCGPKYLDGLVFESLFSQNVWAKIQPIARFAWHVTAYRGFEHMVHLWGIRVARRSRRPIDLLSLMFQLRRSKATELLDRIYAITGLAFDQRMFITEPDYNIHPKQLCLLMTQRFIKTTGFLDIILLGMIRDLDSSSWVCPLLDFADSFSDRVLHHIVEYLSGKQQRLRCGILGSFWRTTSSSHANEPNIRLEGAAINVLGLPLGTTNDESEFKEWGLEEGSALRGGTSSGSPSDWDIGIFESLCRLLLIHSPWYDDSRRLRRAASRLLKDILIARGASPVFGLQTRRDRSMYMFADPGSPIWGVLERVNRDQRSNAELDPPAADKQDSLELAYNISQGLGQGFLFGSKYLGLAAPGKLIGFSKLEVWLLSGLSWPIILEASESGYRICSYALLDSVEVNGKLCRVMNGEAWQTAKKEDFVWVTLV